jgi:hypothetical protein
MIDTISKILSIVLIFLMLIVAPLLISYKIDDAAARREILLEVTLFIDTVRDTRQVSEAQLNALYTRLNSFGLAVDVRVTRMVKHLVIDDNGDVVIKYFMSDEHTDLMRFNRGDGIQVTVREIGVSPARSFMHNIFGAESGPLEFTLAGIVG